MTHGYQAQFDVAYRDLDPAGHVSATIYYVYMLNAYMDYAHKLLEVPLDQGIPQIMVKTSCEYLHPAKWGDTLQITARVVRFGTKSFDIEYVISIADSNGTLVARGASTHVAFDYATDKTVTLSDAFKKRVAEFQGEKDTVQESVGTFG